MKQKGPIGLVWIELTVDSTGRIVRQAVRGDEAPRPVARCVARAMLGWQYERPVAKEGKISLSLVVLDP